MIEESSVDAARYREYLRRVPKTELHCHFASTMRLERLVTWAAERGVDLPTTDPMELARYTGLADFLVLFNAAHAVFRDAEDIAVVAYEGVASAAATTNLVDREYYVNPDYFTPLGLDWPTVLGGLLDGLARAEDEFGVRYAIVPAINRAGTIEQAHAMLDTVLAHRHPAVVGLGQDDLAADGFESALTWAPVFDRARAAGLRLTAHVGEISTSTAQSVLDAVQTLQLDRVDHGYHIADEPHLLDHARDSGIQFCCTPRSSNLLSGWALDGEHPVAKMLRAGAEVNLSTDDEVFFDTTLQAEYEHVGIDMGFGPDVIEAISLAGLEASFADDVTKSLLRERFRAELAEARTLLSP